MGSKKYSPGGPRFRGVRELFSKRVKALMEYSMKDCLREPIFRGRIFDEIFPRFMGSKKHSRLHEIVKFLDITNT